MNRLSGKVAIVTGAGAGIGQACVLRFAQEGAIVLAVDRDHAALQGTAALLTQHGVEAELHGGIDLTNEADVQGLVSALSARHAKVDILLNAAAFAVFDWIDTMSYADWQRTLSGELDIVFLPTRATWPLLKVSGNASIINFASANAYHALQGSAAVAHCAGKGGVLAMTRQLAMEGAPFGIRANSISPGFIRTAATQRHLDDAPDLEQLVLAKNMLKFLGEPSDVAALACFLASDEARYITAADHAIDAGATAW